MLLKNVLKYEWPLAIEGYLEIKCEVNMQMNKTNERRKIPWNNVTHYLTHLKKEKN